MNGIRCQILVFFFKICHNCPKRREKAHNGPKGSFGHCAHTLAICVQSTKGQLPLCPGRFAMHESTIHQEAFQQLVLNSNITSLALRRSTAWSTVFLCQIARMSRAVSRSGQHPPPLPLPLSFSLSLSLSLSLTNYASTSLSLSLLSLMGSHAS